MHRSAKALLLLIIASSVAFAQTAQAPARTATPADGDKSAAYYNFAMGRLYAGMAELEGNRNDYVALAIQHYKEALRLDPSDIIFEELTDLYVGTGKIADAVAQAEDLLRQNPDNLEARRMLGRIYTRAIGQGRPGKVNEDSLRKAIEQFQKITAKDSKDTESWVMLGRLYGISNQSVEAEKAYNSALQSDPNNEDALTGLAMLYSDMGDNQRAIDKLKSVTDKSPNEHTLAALASAYEQLRDYRHAADALKRAVALAPDNPRLQRGLALDLLLSSQFDESLKLYEQLAAQEPRDPEPAFRMAQIYRSQHKFAEARKSLDRAKSLSTDNDGLEIRYEDVNLLEAEGKAPDAIAALKALLDETAKKTYTAAESSNRAMLLERLGILYRGNSQYPQAVDAFRQAGNLDGDGAPRITVQIIDTYRAAKDLDSALREADAALKKFPKERMILLEHANVLADRGKIDDAVAEVRRQVKGGDPQDRETLLSLAQILEKGKRFTEMGKVLDEAEQLSSSNDEKETIVFMRGAMYERQKKFDAAESEFRKVLQLNPENAGALNYLGYMFADRDMRLDEAYQLVRKALDLDPDNGAYLDSLAWVYYRQGKLAEAEGLLLRALSRIGTDATVHEHLGDVYFKQGKTREAIAQWQASLKEFQSGAPSDNDPEEVSKVSKKLESARVRLAQEKK
jgi:tetratricopeptide (TPR) repeat protein